jgi:hypothetical protein
MLAAKNARRSITTIFGSDFIAPPVLDSRGHGSASLPIKVSQY